MWVEERTKMGVVEIKKVWVRERRKVCVGRGRRCVWG